VEEKREDICLTSEAPRGKESFADSKPDSKPFPIFCELLSFQSLVNHLTTAGVGANPISDNDLIDFEKQSSRLLEILEHLVYKIIVSIEARLQFAFKQSNRACKILESPLNVFSIPPAG
jgi:hypothetical protein